jgi:hypothetical protein
MLIDEALQDRKWRGFPALRKVLGDRRIAESNYGFTSISHNMFDDLNNLLTITVLVREQENVIRETDQSLRHEIFDDLNHLERQLKGVSSLFREKAEDIAHLDSKLRESST